MDTPRIIALLISLTVAAISFFFLKKRGDKRKATVEELSIEDFSKEQLFEYYSTSQAGRVREDVNHTQFMGSALIFFIVFSLCDWIFIS